MNKNSMFFVGLDLGDKFSYITIVDQDGEMIEESRLPATKASFQRKFSMLPSCRVAMEVGTHSWWVSHLLTELSHDVLVANARKLRAICHNPRTVRPAQTGPFVQSSIQLDRSSREQSETGPFIQSSIQLDWTGSPVASRRSRVLCGVASV